MLKSLTIQNFALIKELTFSPSLGLNVVTGETGAGKSIIFDALGLLLGNRAEGVSFYDANLKCLVEAEFDELNEPVTQFLNDNEFDTAPTLLIRKEIGVNGRSRSFINDSPASLGQLKILGDLLVSIHNQHQTLEIFNVENQIKILDYFAKNQANMKTYQHQYIVLQNALFKQASLVKNQKEEIEKQGYLMFLLEELTVFDPKISDDTLEMEIEKWANAEEIQQQGNALIHLLHDDEQSMFNQISAYHKFISNIASFNLELNLGERFNSFKIELKELAKDLGRLVGETEVDERHLAETEARFKSFQNLLAKHQCLGAAELILKREDLAKEINSFQLSQANVGEVEIEIKKLNMALLALAQKISENRKSVTLKVASDLQNDLKDLEMPNASIEFCLTKAEKLNINGIDQLEVLFSANKNHAKQPLNKTASGGEASRLALCLKALMHNDIQTLIFDEIDTGVSGKVAKKVGELLGALSKKQQVIAITHSPQVASCATVHFQVTKTEIDQKITTAIDALNHETQISILAGMLSGTDVTAAAIENAKMLLASNK